jgi:large subunit ribosomal protein L23
MITVYPRATEKAYGLSQQNVYVFDAPVSANKQQIIDAVKAQYAVEVLSVKTLVQTGKMVRSMSGRRSRPAQVQRKDLKKAYVTLAEGNSIKVFDEVEQQVEDKTKKEKKESK